MKVAASSTRSVVCSSTSASTAPKMPAMTRARSVVGDHQVVGTQGPVDASVEGDDVLAGVGATGAISLAPRILAASKPCNGSADGEQWRSWVTSTTFVDGTHAGVGEPRLEPGR